MMPCGQQPSTTAAQVSKNAPVRNMKQSRATATVHQMCGAYEHRCPAALPCLPHFDSVRVICNVKDKPSRVMSGDTVIKCCIDITKKLHQDIADQQRVFKGTSLESVTT
jgi:hypothetical protein